MEYIYISYLTHEEDDPAESYGSWTKPTGERRRVDLYDNGMCFAYGGIYGYSEALSKTPYPESPYGLQPAGRGGCPADLRRGL